MNPRRTNPNAEQVLPEKPATKHLPIRNDPRVSGQSRNAPCPCGSGKKTKRCCLASIVAAERKRMSEVPAGSVLVLRGPEVPVRPKRKKPTAAMIAAAMAMFGEVKS